jgi:ubiquinone/menaquinone biosynthesis C-methylase UbiE
MDVDPSRSPNVMSAIHLLPRDLLVRTGPVDHADWNYKGVLGWVQQQRFRLVLRLMGADRFPRLLELGYGSGVFLPELARHAGEVSGVDIHDKTVEVTAALAKDGVSATLKQGVGEKLPFGDASFDAVVAVSVLEFVDDMDQTARELRRVLTPGGSLFVITPGQSPVVDLGLRVLTGKSAKQDFGNKRERVIPALEQTFRVARRIEFPRVAPGVKLYTALRLE